MTPPPSDRRVDELRRQLRSLGYLDAGVDRFVLGPARATRRPAALAILASLRIGLIAALLLGPAAAIGLSGRLPGLVTGPRDAIVVAIYLGILFGAAVALVALIASLLVRAVTRSADAPRRTRLISAGAGAAVTIACLAYLTLWWQTASAGLGWSSPIRTAFALAVAAAISVLLGHAVTVTALAVIAAGHRAGMSLPRVPGTSWKVTLGVGALAFAGAVALLLLTAGSERQAEAPAPLAVRSTGTPVTVIAIDGFDVAFHERLRPAPGASNPPNLFTVLDAARVDLSAVDVHDPAQVWTTIATGVSAETHGVERLETRRVAGLRGRLTAGSTGRVLVAASDLLRLTRPAVASNLDRRVKTFWEVAAQAGFRTGVVNWWATWPAGAADGTIISDRAVLRLEHGGPLDGEIAPATLYEPLRAQWPRMREAARDRATAFFSTVDPTHLPPIAEDVKAILMRSGELDATMIALADAIGADLDLLAVYLPGLDIAQHALLAGEGAAAGPSELGARVEGLRRYYTYLHSLTSGAAGQASRDRMLFVVTEPGRLRGGQGIFAAAGPGIRRGTRVEGRVFNVAPTILHALGLPVSRELQERPIDSIFEPEFLARSPIRYVDTYGPRSRIPTARHGRPLDQEMIDRLRSLGYVK